jgi:hypothetical protein
MTIRELIRDLVRPWFVDKELEELRATAKSQLRTIQVSGPDSAHALNGATAEVLAETENIGKSEGPIAWYYLTQIVRTPAGEYFLLKTTDRAPYVKHLTQSRARLLLKGKYKEPRPHALRGDA